MNRLTDFDDAVQTEPNDPEFFEAWSGIQILSLHRRISELEDEAARLVGELHHSNSRHAESYRNLEEGMALGNRRSWEILGLLYYGKSLPFQRIIDAFEDPGITVTQISRLLLLNYLSFQTNEFQIASMGEEVLRRADLIT